MPVASLALTAAAAACLPPAPAEPSPGRTPTVAFERALAHEPAPRVDSLEEAAVVLVTLDGARWQDVFAEGDGPMPRLHAALATRGAAVGAPGHGAPIAASGPNYVSLPGYTEILSGRRVHPCNDNECAPTTTPTVVDEASERAGDASDVAVFASWERLERAAAANPDRAVVSAGRGCQHGCDVLAEEEGARDLLARGSRAAPYPGYGDFRPDRYTAGLAIRFLETRRPRLLYVSLGEPDEYAHRGDLRGYLGSLRACDEILGGVFDALDRMGPRGRRTTVIVTADHGRARDFRFHGAEYPESARVWLVAAGARIEARGYARARLTHHLADVAPTIRALLGLPPDDDPTAGAPIDELLAPPPRTVVAVAGEPT